MYASATLSLAALEFLVHVDPEDAPLDLVAIGLEVSDDVGMEHVSADELAGNWRETPAPLALQALGDAWVRRGGTAVLSVPSVVVPAERNYALNPAHPHFLRIRPEKPEAFRFDPRLRNR